jgi:hypothetical protein
VRHATLVGKSERCAGAMSSRRIDGMNARRKKEEGSSCGYDEVQYFQWRDGGGPILGAQKRSTRLGLLMIE